MDEAEQLCDRLVVMDGGRIVAEGSPRELIERVLHPRGARAALRPFDHDQAAEKLATVPAERIEVLPDRLLLYVDDGDARPGRGHARGPRAADRAGAPQHAGGRLPAAHRPEAGGRMTALAARQPGRGARAGGPRRPPAGQRWPSARVPVLADELPPDLARHDLLQRAQPGALPGRDGLGLGTLVDQHGTASLGGVSYLAFLAPGLLAATAMQTAVGESHLPGLPAGEVAADLPGRRGHPAAPGATSSAATCCSSRCGWS